MILNLRYNHKSTKASLVFCKNLGNLDTSTFFFHALFKLWSIRLCFYKLHTDKFINWLGKNVQVLLRILRSYIASESGAMAFLQRGSQFPQFIQYCKVALKCVSIWTVVGLKVLCELKLLLCHYIQDHFSLGRGY